MLPPAAPLRSPDIHTRDLKNPASQSLPEKLSESNPPDITSEDATNQTCCAEKMKKRLPTVQTVATVVPVKIIEIEDDVYEALLGRVRDFGDTPNLVLRRELNLGGLGAPVTISRDTPSQEFLASTEFRFAKGVVGRFLAVLSWLYKKDAAAFSVVEEIRGRGRIYFSKSVQELEQSGRSVNPKKIPDSPFWVITTTPTDLKQQILGEVMKALGYDLASIQLAKRAIAR